MIKNILIKIPIILINKHFNQYSHKISSDILIIKTYPHHKHHKFFIKIIQIKIQIIIL